LVVGMMYEVVVGGLEVTDEVSSWVDAFEHIALQ